MTVKKFGWLFLFSIIGLFIIITALALLTTYTDQLSLAVRLSALYGFVALAISTAMTPFLKETMQAFGRPFLTIHHILAIFGLIKLSGVNPFPWWEYKDIRQSQIRLASTFGNPDHLAGYMEIAIPLLLGFFLTGNRTTRKVLLVGAALSMFLAIILSVFFRIKQN